MPAFELSNPPGVQRGGTGYSLAATVPSDARRLLVSGQVGARPDGSLPSDPSAQIEQAFANLLTILQAHGLGVTDIVRTTVFLTDRADLPTFREIRARTFGDHAPTSTLLFVSGLADPGFVVEIEAEAVG